MTASARLAVDIGGTFTDLALEHLGGRSTTKVLTTSAAPELGVLDGVRGILAAAGLQPGDVSILIHGTTLATNALIERKGARTALLTTEGFRDVLALGNESRYDQYDLNIRLPEPLVPRYLRLPVPERLDNEGQVLLPLDAAAVRAQAAVMRQHGVEAIAVGFLHAFVNPVHERQARDILHEELPGIPVSLSAEVSPEMREWERFSTTAANAYVQPLMASYLLRLQTGLHAMGLACPVFLMLSGGGLTGLEVARRFPIRLVESGPAGGAIFAAGIARDCGLDRVLSFDMGGTTAKVCLIDGGQPQASRSFEVARVGRFKRGSGLPLRIPVIEMVEIGAGGGSLAAVDALGRIQVGPESAGAVPGPACYARGGQHPAVTDANLALGRYDPARFAGGSLALDLAAAEAALVRDVGGALGLDAGLAALGVIEVVDENMANAARVHAIESGKTYAGRTLVAFGGGGPVHACRVAEKVGISRILVPSGAGVGSAIGFLRAPVGYEVVRSLYQRLGRFDTGAVNALLADMEAEAARVVAAGSFGAATRTMRTGYMRYVGQGHEIAVALPAHAMAAADVPALRAAFDAEYIRLFDRPVPGSDVEVMGYAVSVATLGAASDPLPPMPPPLDAVPCPHPARAGHRHRPGGGLGGARPHGAAARRASGRPRHRGGGRDQHPGRPRLDRPRERVGVLGIGAHAMTDPTSASLAAIQRQVMWNRLIAVVEEQAQTMIRTAFSTTVREAGDLSAGIFDLQGRMLAQAVTGTPGHVNSMMESVGHFLRRYPVDTLHEGDHLITNDPWLGTGHLHDLTVVSPAFLHGRLVGLFANTAHVIDVGGRGMGADARSVFEEGIYIPILKCFDAGTPNETFFEFIRAGSRLPVELEGDVYSLCACNDAGSRRLTEMMDEFGLTDIDGLAEYIFEASHRATLAEIARIPAGEYSAAIASDGYEAAVTLHARMTVGADAITVDFAGTGGLSGYGINVPAAYTRAYASFGIKCVVAPEIPNNTASLAPFRMEIPENCILNAPRPYPVAVRHVIGHLLPDLMMGCLHQAVPDRVTAEGADCLWNPPLRGGAQVSGPDSGLADFEVITFNSGGTGARPTADGLDGTAFPSGVRTMPVEATENVAPVVIWRKELRPGSGGAGRQRGGLGQIMEIGTKGEREFACNAIFDRIGHAPKGRDGGGDGAPGVVRLKSGRVLRAKGYQVVPAGDRLVLELPGGGGMGEPRERDTAAVARDGRDGFV